MLKHQEINELQTTRSARLRRRMTMLAMLCSTTCGLLGTA